MAFFGYSHMSLPSGTWDILLHQINQGADMAFVFVPSTTLTMDSIAKAETGYATSLYSVMRNIGSSGGISFVTTWVARRSQLHQSILAAHVSSYDLRCQEFLGLTRGLFFHQGSDWSAAGSRSLDVLYGMPRQQAALISFVEMFRIMGFLFLATIPLVLLMRQARQRGGGGPSINTDTGVKGTDGSPTPKLPPSRWSDTGRSRPPNCNMPVHHPI